MAVTNGKRKTENGKLRVSESRSKACFDYAEREQIQDDAVGLKVKTEITAPADCPPETGGTSKAEGVN